MIKEQENQIMGGQEIMEVGEQEMKNAEQEKQQSGEIKFGYRKFQEGLTNDEAN